MINGIKIELQESIQYVKNGNFHRLDGPAYIYVPEGYAEYWIDGKLIAFSTSTDIYSPEKYWNHPDVVAYKYLKEHPELQGFI